MNNEEKNAARVALLRAWKRRPSPQPETLAMEYAYACFETRVLKHAIEHANDPNLPSTEEMRALGESLADELHKLTVDALASKTEAAK